MAKQTMDQPTTSSSRAVIGKGNLSGRSLLRRWSEPFIETRKRVLASCVVLFVLAGCVTALVLIMQHHATQQSYASAVDTTEASRSRQIATQLDGIRNDEPADNASLETKQSYLEALIDSDYQAGDNKAGVTDYSRLLTLMQANNLQFQDIRTPLDGARMYASTGDEDTARRELAKGQTIADSYKDASLKIDATNAISQIRKEWQL